MRYSELIEAHSNSQRRTAVAVSVSGSICWKLRPQGQQADLRSAEKAGAGADGAEGGFRCSTNVSSASAHLDVVNHVNVAKIAQYKVQFEHASIDALRQSCALRNLSSQGDRDSLVSRLIQDLCKDNKKGGGGTSQHRDVSLASSRRSAC